jgi:hypothetical protein
MISPVKVAAHLAGSRRPGQALASWPGPGLVPARAGTGSMLHRAAWDRFDAPLIRLERHRPGWSGTGPAGAGTGPDTPGSHEPRGIPGTTRPGLTGRKAHPCPSILPGAVPGPGAGKGRTGGDLRSQTGNIRRPDTATRPVAYTNGGPEG